MDVETKYNDAKRYIQMENLYNCLKDKLELLKSTSVFGTSLVEKLLPYLTPSLSNVVSLPYNTGKELEITIHYMHDIGVLRKLTVIVSDNNNSWDIVSIIDNPDGLKTRDDLSAASENSANIITLGLVHLQELWVRTVNNKYNKCA